MYPSAANSSSKSGSAETMYGERLRCARADALYGVLVSSSGALRAPFGTTITVCSLTPSRIGIITSRFA